MRTRDSCYAIAAIWHQRENETSTKGNAKALRLQALNFYYQLLSDVMALHQLQLSSAVHSANQWLKEVSETFSYFKGYSQALPHQVLLCFYE